MREKDKDGDRVSDNSTKPTWFNKKCYSRFPIISHRIPAKNTHQTDILHPDFCNRCLLAEVSYYLFRIAGLSSLPFSSWVMQRPSDYNWPRSCTSFLIYSLTSYFPLWSHYRLLASFSNFIWLVTEISSSHVIEICCRRRLKWTLNSSLFF